MPKLNMVYERDERIIECFYGKERPVVRTRMSMRGINGERIRKNRGSDCIHVHERESHKKSLVGKSV